jgi:cob(I)alamin adenosyltransferase
MKIYTKTGDGGETSLLGGTKVSKAALRIEAYGTVDELNAHIGLLRDVLEPGYQRDTLKEIQDRLFTIGAHLASDPEKSKAKMPDLLATDVENLENQIDQMEDQLPILKSFVLPGGHQFVSYCHIARGVSRRTERIVIRLSELEAVENVIIMYLNRLSDYLFVLSRKVAQDLNVPEVPWHPRSH